MAWVRPKHPKRKEPIDPTEALRPVLEYFSCRPSAPSPTGKELARIPKKPLLLYDTYKAKPQKHRHEEPEHHERFIEHNHHQSAVHHRSPEHHQGRGEHHHHRHQVDLEALDYDRASYHERVSHRPSSRYTRDASPPPPPPPPLASYRSNARPGAHLRLMPSRQRIAAESYAPRRPASSVWSSATTPLEM